MLITMITDELLMIWGELRKKLINKFQASSAMQKRTATHVEKKNWSKHI